jgi:uncharacterized protein YwgA
MEYRVKRINDDVLELPDGSLALSMEKAIKEYRQTKPVKYSINDIILFLFFARYEKSIASRISFFKELFIIEREVFAEFLFRWEDVPGKDETNLNRFLKSLEIYRDYPTTRSMIPEYKNRTSNKDGTKTILFQTYNKLSSITLDKYDTKATLRSDLQKIQDRWKPLYVFFVKTEDNKLGIYKKTLDYEDCEFLPYHLGPYSFRVANKLENMIQLGIIEVKGKKNTSDEEFRLSSKGRQIIEPKYRKLPKRIMEKLSTLRKGLDQYSTKDILRHVYTYYPQYRVKSKIAHRYKLITWGRGLG